MDSKSKLDGGGFFSTGLCFAQNSSPILQNISQISPFLGPLLNLWIHLGAFFSRGVFLNFILGVLEVDDDVVFGTKESYFSIKFLASSSDDSAVCGPKRRGLGGETSILDVGCASGGSKIDFTVSVRMESTAVEVSEEESMSW